MIKRVINSNLSLEDALQSVIEQSVANILVQKGIENGEESPITDLGDVKKKGSRATVVSDDGTTIKAKNTNGEIINITSSNGWRGVITTKGNEVSYEFDENGQAILNKISDLSKSYILYSNNITISAREAYEQPLIALFTKNKNGDNLCGLGINDSKIMMNTGNNNNKGGLIIIEDLTNKLNDCLEAIKKLELSFNTHTHAVSGAATAVPNALSTNMSKLPPFNKNEYENKNITHSL